MLVCSINALAGDSRIAMQLPSLLQAITRRKVKYNIGTDQILYLNFCVSREFLLLLQ